METTATPTAKTTAREREAAARAALIESTRALLGEVAKNRDGKPIIYSVLRSVSRSGMKHEISFLVIHNDNLHGETFPRYLDFTIHQLLGLRRSERQGVVVQGCGMDMGFHVVNSLERALGLPFNSIRHEWL